MKLEEYREKKSRKQLDAPQFSSKKKHKKKLLPISAKKRKLLRKRQLAMRRLDELRLRIKKRICGGCGRVFGDAVRYCRGCDAYSVRELTKRELEMFA